MKKRKKVIVGVFVLALIISLPAVLFAAGQKEVEKEAPVVEGIAPGTYFIMVAGEKAQDYIDPITGATMKGWETICKPFEEANPGVKLKFIEVPWGSYLSKIKVGVESGEFDVMHLAAGQNLKHGYFGDLIALDDFIAEDESGFDPAALYGKDLWEGSVLSLAGKHYGLPKTGYCFTHIYDKKLFDEAGVSYPSESASFQELLEKARQIDRTVDGKRIYGVWDRSMYETFRAMMQLKTGRIDWACIWDDPNYLGGDLRKLKWQISSLKPELKETIAYLREMAAMMPAGWSNREGAERFFTPDNNIAISLNSDSGGKFKMLYDSGNFEQLERYGVVAYPVGTIDGKTMRGSAANIHTWGIPKSAKNPKASYEIAKFLSSADIAKEIYDAQWLAPILPEGKSFLNPKDPLSAVSLDALALSHGAERYGYLSVWSQFYPMVKDMMMNAVLDENFDLDAEADKIQSFLEDWTANSIKNGTR